MFGRVAQPTRRQGRSAFRGHLCARDRNGRRTGRAPLTIISSFAVVVTFSAANDAHGAGAAYQVDTVEISEAGSCKVESWVSWASNRDFSATTSPACATEIVRPMEFSMQLNRSRSDGEWGTAATPKVKVNLEPSAIGKFGFAIAATATYDLIARENTAITLYMPATIRLSDVMRINLNGGWLWDRTLDRHYATYGAGVDLRTPDNVWTVTAEVFGQIGSSLPESRGVTQPRWQTGLRWRPVDRFNIDVIYGRNITGEGASWITVASVIRFPPQDK
jgi:hypothetical protein